MPAIIARAVSRRWLYLVLFCLCLFVFGHDLHYSVDFQSIQEQSGAGVADLVESGSWVRRICLFALAGVSILTLVLRRDRTQIRKHLAQNWLYLCFIALALCSVLWADDPGLTLRRSMEFVLISTAAYALSEVLDPAGLLQFSFYASLSFVTVGVIAECSLGSFHPATADYRFCGTLHPNHQAWQCAMLVLSACALCCKGSSPRRPFYFACGLFGFLFLLLTKSRTTLGAIVVALLFFVSLGLERRNRLRIFAMALFAIAAAALFATFAQSAVADLHQSELAGRGEDSTATFTGRLPLWSMALQFVAQRPIAGYGFYSFWTPDHILYFSDALEWGVPESHNGYIELLLSLGVVGLSLYLLLLFGAGTRFYRAARVRLSVEMTYPTVLYIFFLLVMFCDVIALDINLITTIVFAYIWKAAVLRDRKEVADNHELRLGNVISLSDQSRAALART